MTSTDFMIDTNNIRENHHQAARGIHTKYHWKHQQDPKYNGEEYTISTICQDRSKPPQHVYVLRHMERLDFIYKWWSTAMGPIWTHRAFDKNGKFSKKMGG